MSARCCPVPNCTHEVPAGPHAIFCVEHHFQMPSRTTRNLFALKARLGRLDDEGDRAHLREQIDAYVHLAVRGLAAGPATLAGEARRA